MFKWFRKLKYSKNENKITKSNNYSMKITKSNNYSMEENGDIRILERKSSRYFLGYYKEYILIPKSSIIFCAEDKIVFEDHENTFNFYSEYYDTAERFKAIENKENLIKYKETKIKTYTYLELYECWELNQEEVIKREVLQKKTPLEIFMDIYKSKYKLIETENEFNNYISSSLDCDTWCRKKLYNKMKELELGEGFINQFADLIGNNLDKYHAMIDLSNEISDKDTLMYLYTYKFGKK